MALVGFVIFVGMLVTGSCVNQTALMDKLFSNYKSEMRPICGRDVPIEVQIGIAIRQVIDLNEPKQVLTVNAWIRLKWYDCQVKWNASEYGGLSILTVPFEKVWTPDITLYDNAGNFFVGAKDYRPVLSSDGSVSYNFPTIIQSLCKVDVTYFPFDTQTCALKFGSWAYHGLHINSTNKDSAGDISSYKVNSEWDLVSVPVERHVVYYGCCPEPYPDVTFYVNLRRKPFYYVVNLLFPCILISAVGLLGFLLPPDAGEKVSLEITVLLSLSVFMLIVSGILPPTSETFPYVGIYFCLTLALVASSLVLTVLVLNVHFKGQHGIAVPRWVRNLFLGTFARLLCVKTDMSDFTVKKDVNGDHQLNGITGVFNELNQDQFERNDSRVGVEHSQQQASPLNKVMEEQLAVLQQVNNRYIEKDAAESIEEDWKKVAVVMDRLFLVLFFVSSVVCTLGILLQYVGERG